MGLVLAGVRIPSPAPFSKLNKTESVALTGRGVYAKVNFISKFEEYLIARRFSKMEKVAEGISDFGDFKSILFRTSDGRHVVRIVPLQGSEKTPHRMALRR